MTPDEPKAEGGEDAKETCTPQKKVLDSVHQGQAKAGTWSAHHVVLSYEECRVHNARVNFILELIGELQISLGGDSEYAVDLLSTVLDQINLLKH